jgi:hypothetical protein
MKFLLFAAALLIASTAFADTTLSRNNDGMTARCSEKADVGRRSYSLTLLSEKITTQDAEETRDVALEVRFTKCAEVGNGYKLVDSSSDEVLHSYIVLNDGTLGMTDNKLVAVNFYAVDAKGVTLSTLSLGKAPGTYRIYLSFKTDVKKAYVLAELTSNISSPVGSIDGLVQRYGGFVLSFE